MNLKTLICYFLLICTAHANEGGLAITVEPKDAEIYVNGVLKMNTSPAYLILSEGKYQVEVKKTGMNTESFEIIVPAEGTVVKKVTLTPIASPALPPVIEAKPDLLALLKPERGKFETEIEFSQRRTKLLIEFNQGVAAHQPDFQMGTAILNHDNYDLDSGTFPIEIEWVNWAEPFLHIQKLSPQNIAALRDDAQNLWQEGQQKPLFAYFKLGKHTAEVDKMVLVGSNKEWRVEPVTGHLFVVFPNFLSKLANRLTKSYQKTFPYTLIHLTATENLFDPLLTGKANLVISPREMTEEEQTVFKNKFEYEPTVTPIAMKMYAVYVHKSNPLTFLTMQGLDAIFSTTRTCGLPKSIDTWGQATKLLEGSLGKTYRLIKNATKDVLGVQKTWEQLPIILFGVNSESLAYPFFKKSVLCGGNFKASVQQQKDQNMLAIVGGDRQNIGFATFQETNEYPSVRALSIYNQREAGVFSSGEIEPTRENALSGKYPLVHYLWIYTNKSPTSTLPRVEQELLNFVLSPDGQEILETLGFIPVP
jgi:phosphate transport system substrate-binding protein